MEKNDTRQCRDSHPQSAKQINPSLLEESGGWDSQRRLTHLQLATAAALSLLALRVISRVVKGGGRPRTGGAKGKVPSGDEGASVHVVGENIMPDELTEQQYQVKELHPLTLTSGVRWRGREGEKRS